MSAVRVLVVDDSVVIRRLVTGLLDEHPGIEVVGTAVNGRAALQKAEQLAPDLITMDIEMPEMDGIEAVRRLRASGNRAPIIMFSTLTERGAIATLDALAAGASDYVAKPANVGSVGRSMDQVRDALIPRITSLVPRAGRSGTTSPAAGAVPATATPASPTAPSLRERSVPPGGYRMLLIGSSTGGPEALNTLLRSLPPLPVPVAVVQHMPPVFTQQLAARLDRNAPCTVTEAGHGQVLAPGTVVIAPGDHHLVIDHSRAGGLIAGLHQGPAVNYCRPAVDLLFESAAQHAGGPVLAVVLTGMGADGARGAEHIVAAGGSVIVQDQQSSIVWGMPGAVATAGLAEQVLPLDEIGTELQRRLQPASVGAVRSNG